ncbi:SDR family oxidoreductase [Evansella cellulosilytica]|uniref:Short-chain dehydrogenase/reductase SDR n=1 Tax=Evansella cellulosilytica (strain ATCC 21833 / DSM 2522 / FERM P-1141 / JCM 9156 / N-4) TaxID=649639 RepID=E6U0C8_EVAC2|nr:SDR family NAD(P)-dependent oxidoreductase [Evansella cellulosilytica]ADU30244.1 short-chain dehydrogenase/reductase SDR [Evansella cellulosilytica DSM 2522]
MYKDSEVAVITGGGSGIGKAAALKLAKEGYFVYIIDLKEERGKTVKNQIIDNGGSSEVLDIDVKDEARIIEGFQQIKDNHTSVQTIFINAGINGILSPIEAMSITEWENTLETNLRSTFLFVKHSIPLMKQEGGSIIITSSINGNRVFSNIGMSAYSTSKAGQVAFMKMAALELANYHIRVNAICPGAITTNIGENTTEKHELDNVKIPVNYPEGNQPLEHGPGSPEQVAELVYFLSSNASSHITGTEIYIDGAESLL